MHPSQLYFSPMGYIALVHGGSTGIGTSTRVSDYTIQTLLMSSTHLSEPSCATPYGFTTPYDFTTPYMSPLVATVFMLSFHTP